MLPKPSSTIAAYQRLQLLEIGKLYDELHLDLDHYLDVERSTAKEIESLEGEFGEIRETLSSLGVNLQETEPSGPCIDATAPVPDNSGKRYRRVNVEGADSIGDLVAQAEDSLSRTDLNLDRDPLLQVLSSREVAGVTESYTNKYGDVSWDRSDYLVVLLAGFVATLLDICLVKTPLDSPLTKGLKNNPLTEWVEKNRGYVKRYQRRAEEFAKVPYDATMDKELGSDKEFGLRPKTHRVKSPGHDPSILGLITAIIDIKSGKGTYIDKYGILRRRERSTVGPESSTLIAFLKVLVHLLTDAFTKAGIPPPNFTLLQLVKSRSPFVLNPKSGEKVSWHDVITHMYAQGYDLRHFATMKIIPLAVELIIGGWWLCKSLDNKSEAELAAVKMTSMLLLGHTIATSGNLLKTGIIYRMDPLALNWAEFLRLLPVTVSWMVASVERDRRIREKLGTTWMSMYQANLGC